jgi:MFS family permease
MSMLQSDSTSPTPAQDLGPAPAGLAGVNSAKLFLVSCLALISTSVAFAVIGDIMGPLKTAFVLTNAQVGWIGGAALWGFTISIVALGPFCDAIGMKRLLGFAFVCHLVGPLTMMVANGFGMLFVGALILALGNGTVEAVCNPLVATIYPDRKTTKLNQFHVWFPGGIVIGGLICFGLAKMGNHSWQLRLVLILIPTVVYGVLFLKEKFPATERVQSGISFGGMVSATLLRPLFLLMFACMIITASLELGTNRWITAILESGGIHGILVLVWISGLMAVLRYNAGPIVTRVSPPGLLVISSVLAGIGLFWLSYAETTAMAFAAATVFALGVCYFWPTMLGVVAERVPKGGALALALMGGVGMFASGLIASPLIGKIIDQYLPERLPAVQTMAVIEDLATIFPQLQAEAPEELREDYVPTINAVAAVMAKIEASPDGALPHPETANALRAAIGAGVDHEVVGRAKGILNPAENYGGRMSFRKLAPFSIILVVVFGAMYAMNRASGGYKADKITD